MVKDKQNLEKTNADFLVQLIMDPETPTDLQVKMMSRLLEARQGDNFFVSMLREMVSYGACPDCGHENHWLIPEEELNKIGYVTHREDPRVKKNTTEADCPRWQQACGKKKVSV